MSTRFKSVLKVASLLLLGTALVLLAQVPRENFPLTLALFAVAFGAMLGSYFLDWRKDSFWWLLGVGLLFRGSLFFFAPQWSEDGVRFLWDGQLLRQGQNPYGLTPAQVQEQQGEGSGLGAQLFQEAAVAWVAAVGGHDRIEWALFGTTARKANFHGHSVVSLGFLGCASAQLFGLFL